VPPGGPPAVEAVIDIGGGEAYGLAADANSVWAVSYEAGTLSRIDPATNSVAASARLGPAAASVLTNGDDVWVAGYDGVIYRIDPTTAKATTTAKVGEACCDLSFGNGLLWVVDPSGSVKGLSPQTNTVEAEFAVDVDRQAHTNAVFAGGFVWASSDSTALFRIDPSTGQVDQFDIGGGVPFVARDGLLWGATSKALWAIDEQTGDVIKRVDLQRSIEVLSLDVGTSTLWVGIRHPGRVGAVQHIDIASGAVLDEFTDVDIPARIVLAFDSVWVTESAGNEVVRIGPFMEA
jgi:streptogramin lyase